MKKKTITLGIIATLIGLASIPLNTYALTNISTGKELTESEYKNLTDIGLDDDTIANLDAETFNKYKDYVIEEKVTTTKYYKEVKIAPFSLGGQPNYINIEVTEDEYNNSDITTYANDTTSTHETTYKKLELTLAKVLEYDYTGKNARIVRSTLTWKKLPDTRSYDVYAIYSQNSFIKDSSATQVMTELAPNENLSCALTLTKNHGTNYPANSSAWNSVTGINAPNYNAEGVSMKMDTAVTPCNWDMGVAVGKVQGYKFTILSGATPKQAFGTATVRASYQHAQYSVSFSDSKNYGFSTAGFGGVIKFNNSTIGNKYDKMGGVEATL